MVVIISGDSSVGFQRLSNFEMVLVIRSTVINLVQHFHFLNECLFFLNELCISFFRMNLKKMSTTFYIFLLIAVACNCQHDEASGRRQRPAPVAASAPPAPVNNREGSNFDQERLIALFGSNAQPVYGNRDPNTGRVVMIETGSPLSNPIQQASHNNNNNPAIRRPLPPPHPKAATSVESNSPSHFTEEEEEEEEDDDEEGVEGGAPIDRKDTRVPETNEINPFELLPPQFHDLLNIPIHDYGNGTTYNPYDKYKVPSKIKYPLVSTGYANTKYQGSPSSTTPKPVKPVKPVGGVAASSSDYDYEGDDLPRPPVKSNSNKRPTAKPKATTTTDSYYDDDYEDAHTTKSHRPSTTPQPPSTAKRPTRPAVYQFQRPEQPSRDSQQEQDALAHHQPSTKPRPEYQQPPAVKRPSFVYDRPHEQSDNSKPKFTGHQSSPQYEADELEPINVKPKPAIPERHNSGLPVPRPNFSPVGESYDRIKPYHPQYQHEDEDDEHLMVEIKVTPKPFYAANENQNYGGHVEEGDDEEKQQKNAGQFDDMSDIIYDYDDERSNGEGVIFMVDKGVSGLATGPEGAAQQNPLNSRPLSVTANPVNKSPYPTVASRERLQQQQQQISPAFRPSAPLRNPGQPEVNVFTPKQDIFLPGSQQQQTFHPQSLPVKNSPPPLPQQQHQPNGFGESPRPPFRITPPEQPHQPSALFINENQQQQQANIPNILPLFRPNANPTDEFQFIKHPQNIQHELQRQQLGGQQSVGPSHFRPNAGQHQEVSPQRNRPGGVSPLPSALQTPFSSISQAVANFFGRRTGLIADDSQQRSLGSESLEQGRKLDRLGLAQDDDDEEIVAEESRPFVLFSRPDTPLLPRPAMPIASSIDRSSEAVLSLQQQHQQPIIGVDPVTGTSKQVMGIRANPDSSDEKPPAFYVYTTRELAEGRPPYLVVGPVLSGPPKVAGAELVHTAPAQAMQKMQNPAINEAQRRNDFPGDDDVGNTRINPNALPHHHHQPPSFLPPTADPQTFHHNLHHQAPAPAVAVEQDAVAGPGRRPPFFPISQSPSANKKNNRPSNGLSPPPPAQQQLQFRPPVSQKNPPVGLAFPTGGVPEPDLSNVEQFSNPHHLHGIAPLTQGIAPPRVPLSQKDVASLFSNPTLLHNRPGLGEDHVQQHPSQSPLFNYQPDHHHEQLPPTDEGFFVKQQENGQETKKPAVSLFDSLVVASQQQQHTVSPSVQTAPIPPQSLFTPPTTAATTARPPNRNKPTKPAATSTTTPAYIQSFGHGQEQPVTYSTIQKEDGNKIAVVHPAYIVTYKNKPPPPSLEYLQAPFIPSVESGAIEEGELESGSTTVEKWQAGSTHNNNQQQSFYIGPDSLSEASVYSEIAYDPNKQTESGNNVNYESGFYPIAVPGPQQQS